MSRWISQNISLFLMSLILAFVFWAAATEAEDPTRTDTYLSQISVEVIGLDESMVAYGITNDRVRVEIKAPESVWATMRPEDIVARVDVSDVGTGTLSLPVEVEVAQKPAVVTLITPPEISLTIERLAEKEVPVEVIVQGSPAIGFEADAPSVAPQVVRIQGPQSLVSKAFKTQVFVSVDEQEGSVRSDYAPQVVDQNEQPVPEITVIPKSVTVNVPVWQLGYIRDMAVTVSLTGQPATGYRVANLVVDPPVVKVFGQTNIVRAVPGFLQTQPINLEGITQSLTSKVALQMPEGISVFFPAKPEVTATITVEVIRSGLTLEVTPTIRGLKEDLTTAVGVEAVVVILSGPLNIMENLTANDVDLELNLVNLTPGDYTIVPVITVPDDVVIENVIPEAVPVKIEIIPAPELIFE
ncbi:MAG: CdaR family protein [Anaerolineae bacterium]|nr:CdaR family protein [Anaerolineae bacterium]